ncbi:MAG: toprim domain-containing protein [Actinobacteria bacterium]|nr:toprim domain-containing protein [Actinomycetota bacterium]
MNINIKTISIKEYLISKNITFIKRNNELITKCLFNNCDNNSKGKEAHLYLNIHSGQYECKKCGVKGNIFTLAKYFGDDLKDIGKEKSNKYGQKKQKDFENLVNKCNQSMPERIRTYLKDRGINDELIEKYKLGYGYFYNKNWITIPIKDRSGKYIFFKLREDPDSGNKKITFPRGSKAQIYDWDTLKKCCKYLFICEGELDRLLLISKGLPAITSTHGVNTFPDVWFPELSNIEKILVVFDKDKSGKDATINLLERFKKNIKSQLYRIDLPEEVGEHGDVTDYFIKCNCSKEELLRNYSYEFPEKIDPSKFDPLNSEDIAKILDITVKKDNENKVIVFYCMLLTFTEEDQFNISFNAPSSTGKSYIPLELASLFPGNNVIEVGYCSPTAFFHDHKSGDFDMDLEGYHVDLSKKILIFLDQPHNLLIGYLRPILSHDKKIINIKITDRKEKYGLKTKNIEVKGYPSVIFCTAGLKIDEQEATRFLLLSPEITQEKINAGIILSLKKDCNRKAFKNWVESNSERQLLKKRIEAIKNEDIEDVIIKDEQKILKRFYSNKKAVMPRHQRDIKRLISLIKASALLNLWWRERDGRIIYANAEDIEEGFMLWEKISKCQELNIPPYIFNIYKEVILPLFNEKNNDSNSDLPIGILRKEIMGKYLKVLNKPISDWSLRQEILPMLESAGLIYQEPDPDNKRRMVIFPVEVVGSNNIVSGDVG